MDELKASWDDNNWKFIYKKDQQKSYHSDSDILITIFSVVVQVQEDSKNEIQELEFKS